MPKEGLKSESTRQSYHRLHIVVVALACAHYSLTRSLIHHHLHHLHLLLLLLLHLHLEVLLCLRCLFICSLLLAPTFLVRAILASLLILHHLHLLFKHHLRLLPVLLPPALVLLSLQLELLALLRGLRLFSSDCIFLHPLLGLVRLLHHELHSLHHVLINLILGHLLAPCAFLDRLY